MADLTVCAELQRLGRGGSLFVVSGLAYSAGFGVPPFPVFFFSPCCALDYQKFIRSYFYT